MVGWHPQLEGHEFEQALGDGDGQGSLVCCSPWDHKVQFSSIIQLCPTLGDMTTGKIIALTRWTFVSKVMSLLFNRPSRFVIVFHLRSKCLFFFLRFYFIYFALQYCIGFAVH